MVHSDHEVTVTRTCKVFGKWFFYALMAISPFFVWNQVIQIYEFYSIERSEPVVWFDAYANPKEVYPGDVVTLNYVGHRDRHCRAKILDVIIRKDNRMRVHTVFDGVGGYSDPGPIKSKVKIVVPEIEPGEYLVRSRITHDCADGRHDTHHPPDIPFTVADSK